MALLSGCTFGLLGCIRGRDSLQFISPHSSQKAKAQPSTNSSQYLLIFFMSDMCQLAKTSMDEEEMEKADPSLWLLLEDPSGHEETPSAINRKSQTKVSM